jgi:putative transposase
LEEKQTYIRTIKVQLSPSVEQRNHLHNIQYESWRAANDILFIQWQLQGNTDYRTVDSFNLMDKIFESEAVQSLIEAGKMRTKPRDRDKTKDNNKFIMTETLRTSLENASYQYIRDKYELPSYVSSQLNRETVKLYKYKMKDIQVGKTGSIAYKKSLPIPVYTGPKLKVILKDGKLGIELWKTWGPNENRKSWDNFIPFDFGRDRSGNKKECDNLAANETKLKSFKLMYNKQKNKWFILLPVEDEVNQAHFVAGRRVGVDIGVNVFAVCAVNDLHNRKYFGVDRELVRAKVNFKKQKRNLQKNLVTARGGKGRKKKLKALDRFRDKEKRFTQNMIDQYSLEIVKFALTHKAEWINMELLEALTDDEPFFKNNFPYFQLQEKIKYKAMKFGIKTMKVDPYHTSKECHHCGEIGERDDHDKTKFVCVNPECKECGEVQHADYNAAKNISMITKELKNKKDGMYYKTRKAKAPKNSSLKKHNSVEQMALSL